MDEFKLNRRDYKFAELLSLKLDKDQLSPFEYGTLRSIQDWQSAKDSFVFKTSGSTGKPKQIKFSREQIRKSAQRTIDTFHLQPGQAVLCCLNTSFVAGFMMLIRAIEGNLKLTIQEPSSNPLAFIGDHKIDFVAMTPNQLKGSLDENPEKIHQIGKLLLGGAGLHPVLENRIRSMQVEAYHGYAMTETLTHVAVRNISKSETEYRALNGVVFRLNKKGCLVINDEWLGIQDLETNDLVDLVDDRTFIWIGRNDHVVNSGGIKIQLEELENNMDKILHELDLDIAYCLVPQPDIILSNRLVLLIEDSGIEISVDQILNKLKADLPKYHAPREIIMVPELFHTRTGKIDRRKNIEVYIKNSDKKDE